MWKRRIEENREFLFSCIFGNDCINDGFGEKVHSWTLRNNWEHLVDGSMQINEYIYIYKILLVIKIKNYNRDVLLTKKKKNRYNEDRINKRKTRNGEPLRAENDYVRTSKIVIQCNIQTCLISSLTLSYTYFSYISYLSSKNISLLTTE